MFTMENTNGYSQEELDKMNQAVRDKLINYRINPDASDYELDADEYAVKKRVETEVFNSTF